jgi:quercetin dioxygenase-like cupin family protein
MEKDTENTGKSKLPDHPFNLEGFINYQDSSVVSKTLIGKKTGTVTLFAFDSGQGLNEHTAPYEALISIIEGEAEITIGDKIHKVSSGETVKLPVNVAHAVKSITRFKMLLIMIKS